MTEGCIPKDILYGELASGKTSAGSSHLDFKDVCKCYIMALDVYSVHWEKWQVTGQDREPHSNANSVGESIGSGLLLK